MTVLHDPAELRETAVQLAAEAAAHVRRRRPEVFGAAAAGGSVRTKSTPTDPVTVVDTETERLLRDRLAATRPGEPVLGEEEGGPSAPARPGAVTWVLDPIDGTVNFVYGIPAYGVSVAARVDGVSVAGAVADVAAGTLYAAARGAGARVRDADGAWHPLRCTAVTDLAMTLVGTGFAYARDRRARQAAVVAEMLPAVRDIRRIGSAALDLCAVAAGRLDGYYEHGLKEWDWAAGALIAAEAGAAVRFPADLQAGAVVAAAPGVIEALTALLAGRGALDGLPG